MPATHTARGNRVARTAGVGRAAAGSIEASGAAAVLGVGAGSAISAGSATAAGGGCSVSDDTAASPVSGDEEQCSSGTPAISVGANGAASLARALGSECTAAVAV